MRSLVIIYILSVKMVLVYTATEDFVKINITIFPYTAAIFRETSLLAGGTILSELFVMCRTLYTRSGDKMKVRVGSTNALEGGDLVDVGSFIQHPKYNETKHENGIALAKLKKRLTFGPEIMPAPLPDDDYDLDRTYIIAGWGSKHSDTNDNKHLRFTLVKTTKADSGNCKGYNDKDPTLVCVEEPAQVENYAFVGTPMLDEDGRVQAILLREYRSFTVFIRTHPYKAWLIETMENNSKYLKAEEPYPRL